MEMKPKDTISWAELSRIFSEHEHQQPAPTEHLVGYVRFNNGEWWNGERSELQRTFRVSSNNKAFLPNMGGWSVYAVCLGDKSTLFHIDELIVPRKYGFEWKDTIDCCWLDGGIGED